MIFAGLQDRRRAALAAEGARALAKMAGWAMEPCGTVLALLLSAFGYSDEAQIIIGYWHHRFSYRKMIAAIQDARTDMLMIEPGHGMGRWKTLHLTLILCRAGQVIIHKGLRLWSEDFRSPLWLVPDPQDIDAYLCCFSLHPNGIGPEIVTPFADPIAAQMGLRVADLQLMAEAGGHFL